MINHLNEQILTEEHADKIKKMTYEESREYAKTEKIKGNVYLVRGFVTLDTSGFKEIVPGIEKVELMVWGGDDILITYPTDKFPKLIREDPIYPMVEVAGYLCENETLEYMEQIEPGVLNKVETPIVCIEPISIKKLAWEDLAEDEKGLVATAQEIEQHFRLTDTYEFQEINGESKEKKEFRRSIYDRLIIVERTQHRPDLKIEFFIQIYYATLNGYNICKKEDIDIEIKKLKEIITKISDGDILKDDATWYNILDIVRGKEK